MGKIDYIEGIIEANYDEIIKIEELKNKSKRELIPQVIEALAYSEMIMEKFDNGIKTKTFFPELKGRIGVITSERSINKDLLMKLGIITTLPITEVISNMSPKGRQILADYRNL